MFIMISIVNLHLDDITPVIRTIVGQNVFAHMELKIVSVKIKTSGLISFCFSIINLYREILKKNVKGTQQKHFKKILFR